MTTLVILFVGIVIGAALFGAYLFGRERGRLSAIDEVARTFGAKLLGRGKTEREREPSERAQAEMAVVGENESNADGSSRQDIIAKLSAGDDIDLMRERGNAAEPNAVRVVSRRGEIGRLSPADADTLAPYLDSGGRVSASIAFINGGTSTNGAYSVVISVVALQGA